MSKKNLILHEEITSSQAFALSVLGSAGTHLAISINLYVPMNKKIVVEMDEEDLGGVLDQLVFGYRGKID